MPMRSVRRNEGTVIRCGRKYHGNARVLLTGDSDCAPKCGITFVDAL